MKGALSRSSAASPSARSARGHSGTDGKLRMSARDRAGRDRAARPPSARATPRHASSGRKSGRFCHRFYQRGRGQL